jgi:hypothetical protein
MIFQVQTIQHLAQLHAKDFNFEFKEEATKLSYIGKDTKVAPAY